MGYKPVACVQILRATHSPTPKIKEHKYTALWPIFNGVNKNIAQKGCCSDYVNIITAAFFFTTN